MPALPRRLKNPRTWLMLFASVVALVVIDTFRRPEQQVTASLYVGAVRLYQRFGRPLLKGHMVCRFHPSCSDYSIEAVERHGIRRGLVLTVNRLRACNHGTPLGTYDPVPSEEDRHHESHE
jgi:putative membrane protein insertion efficiency factor